MRQARAGGHRARRVGGRPDDRVRPLAAPAGVPVQPGFSGDCREVCLPRAVAAAAVRRAGHRQLGRVFGRVAASGVADDLPDERRLLPSRSGPHPHLHQGGGGSRDRRVLSGSPVPGCRSSRRCAASPWRSRSPRSVSSPRTRCFRSPTAAAAPHTSMSPAGGGKRSAGPCTTSSGSPWPRSSRSAWSRPRAPPRCGSGSRAARMSTCSPSSTSRVTSARTAGTSWGGPSSTAPWRTSTRSRRCGGWSSTRTTPYVCRKTSGSARPGPTASWRSRPNASTCWSPSSSKMLSRSARPTSATR